MIIRKMAEIIASEDISDGREAKNSWYYRITVVGRAGLARSTEEESNSQLSMLCFVDGGCAEHGR